MGKFEKYKKKDKGKSKLNKYRDSQGQTIKDATETADKSGKSKIEKIKAQKEKNASTLGNVVIAVLAVATAGVWVGVLVKLFS